MKKISITLLFTLLFSICQPNIIWAETINNSNNTISNELKETVEDLGSLESSATIETNELSNSQETTESTVSNDSKEREVFMPDVSTTDIATGRFGTSDWFIDNAGVLHIQQGEFDDTPMVGTYHQSPWYAYRNSINKIVFEGPVVASTIMERLFESLPNVTEIENISYLDTSNTINMQRVFADCTNLVSLDLTSWDTSKVQDIFSLFNGCVNLENLEVSTWNTQNMTAVTYAFARLPKLKVLDLSNWKLAPINSAQGVFMEDSSLESLDLSGFNMTNLDRSNSYATSRFFQNTSALKELKLSSNFRFIGSDTNTNPELPMITADDNYTGIWQNVGEGTINNPKGTDSWTSRELMSNFDLTPKNDTYVWQPVKRIAADVTVIYVDEKDEEIYTPITIGGNIGELYDATSPEYKLIIDGYTLDESNLPDNASGTFSADAQTVVYKYKKDPVKAADVRVTYVDEMGEEIHTAQTIGGNIGELYDATSPEYKLIIDGYTLDESNLPDNASGTFSADAQTVVYKYKKDPVKAADVRVTYVDEMGEEIHTAQTIGGNIGEPYDATSPEYKLAIDGYTLDESKLPEHMSGVLSDKPQAVEYVYTKNTLKMATITINYVDENGKKIHDSIVVSGNIDTQYDVSTAKYKLTINGYTLNESKLPKNSKGTFEKQNQTVTYVYSQNKTIQNNQKPTNTNKQLPLAGETNKQSLMMMGTGIILLSGVLYFVNKRKQKHS
ncbi:hypothetical protein IGJ02_000821 [Enterococcus sp. DIV0724b]|uniref:MucBP domain-containing protein n=1 Tax=Enterococcus sp. DIV0724b TaxID=2774694 RepID=UPI003D2FCB9B